MMPSLLLTVWRFALRRFLLLMSVALRAEEGKGQSEDMTAAIHKNKQK
jgi:hypothetical protein